MRVSLTHKPSGQSLVFLVPFLYSAIASSVQIRNETQYTFTNIKPSKSLEWYPCLDKYFCAVLDVPLDYQISNGSRASVPLIKIPAEEKSPNGTYQGMLLTNPGGPGQLGINSILTEGYPIYRPIVGTNYDIVSFDPRGIGRSLPVANCSISTSSKHRRRTSDIEGPDFPAAVYEQVLIPQLKQLGDACEAAIGSDNQAGKHMSTSTNVKDMISIIDAFAKTDSGSKAATNASLLNYWGFSYGTFIGETFASMYPDRVGRIALDGVVDPEDYSSGTQKTGVLQIDDAIHEFFTLCSEAGSNKCAFNTGNTADDIQTRFQNIFIPLNVTAALTEGWKNSTDILTALNFIKHAIWAELYSPIEFFPILAQQLVVLETTIKKGNVSEAALTDAFSPAQESAYTTARKNQDDISAAVIAEFSGTQIPDIPGLIDMNVNEWSAGIFCSDSPSVYNESMEKFEPMIDYEHSKSFIGGDIWAINLATCIGWPIKAVERFAGPFGGNTANPILFVSNTIDPTTPIINSKNTYPKYKDAQLLTIEGVGHLSTSTRNKCAYAKISKFFQTGSLPGSDNYCASEPGPFGVTMRAFNSSSNPTGGSGSGSGDVKPSSAGRLVVGGFGLMSTLFAALCAVGL